jgi:protein-disulfide isomerase
MMRALGFAAAAALIGTVAIGAPTPKKPTAAPAARDWARLVTATPEGGFRIGNPAAPLKLVEYASFTCSHCAQFAEEGFPALLRDHVRSGRLSFEFRNFVRDPYDMAAALVARCASPANFFPLTHRIFETREQWIAKFLGLTPEQTKELNALPVPQRLARFARIGGFTALGSQAGVPAARAQQCLADKKSMDQLVAMRQVAIGRHSLQGTPTFILNGRNTEVHDWASLQPLLKSPGG